MKVLLYHLTPFAFTHGPLQIQIEQTREALLHAGVEVEFFRWYDDDQTGDVIHFFGQIPSALLFLIRLKGIKVVISHPQVGAAARSPMGLWFQRTLIRILKKVLPSSRFSMLNLDGYELADACIVSTPHEAHLIAYIFGTPSEKVHVVPGGIDDILLKKPMLGTEMAQQLKRIYESVLKTSR